MATSRGTVTRFRWVLDPSDCAAYGKRTVLRSWSSVKGHPLAAVKFQRDKITVVMLLIPKTATGSDDGSRVESEDPLP